MCAPTVFTYLLCLLMPMSLCLPLVPKSVHEPAPPAETFAQSLPSKSSNFPTGIRSEEFKNFLKQLNSASKSSGNVNIAVKLGAQYFNLSTSARSGMSAASSGSSIPSSAKPPIMHTASAADSLLRYDVNRHTVVRNSNKVQNNFKNVGKDDVSVKITSMPTEGSGKLEYRHDYSVLTKNDVLKVKLDLKLDSSVSDPTDGEYVMPIAHPRSLQLAVKDPQHGGHSEVNDMLLTVGTGLAALFSLGLILGIFSCCCKKKQQSDENENAEKNNKQKAESENTTEQLNKTTADSRKASEVINSSDIPVGEKDLDDPISIKDKIKAMDNMLIIQPSPTRKQPSPDPTKRKSYNEVKPSPDPDKRRSQHELKPSQDSDKRKSQNEVNLMENKALYTGMSRQPQIVVSQDELSQVALRDKMDHSKSTADNISKSDTQDDISDKIFDNVSMQSSTISQPYNPDVVIADTDDEDEFAEIQRGTVILKSFQRAKPPRNRSPATRTSKGKIRKPRPVNLDRSRDKDRSQSPKARPSQDDSLDGEPASTPSSINLPSSQGTSSKTNSLEKLIDSSKSNSLEKQAENSVTNGSKLSGSNKKSESAITKSSELFDFDSVMSKSVSSISSDIVTQKKRESPKNARYAKNKGSPKLESEVRNESPVRTVKSKEREITEKDRRTESPNRYKKSKDSPVDKRKQRKKERDQEVRNSRSEVLSTDIREDREVRNSSAGNRLSGIPSNTNNIFYLIDPTVKNKCKSVGDIIGDDIQKHHRKSGDYSKEATKATKHKVKDNPETSAGHQEEEAGSPVKRERTQSDPYRKSKVVEQTPL